MNIRSFAIATALTSATALGAFAANTATEKAGAFAGVAEMSKDYAYDGDTYEVDGMTVANMGGEMREDSDVALDTDTGAQIDGAETTSSDEIIAAAVQGTPVSTSDDKVIGTVAYTQELTNGNRVFVSIDDASGIPVQMIGFDVSSMEVKSVGEGLEYSTSLEQLIVDVNDRI